MRVCLIMPPGELAATGDELQDVANVFSATGHVVHIADASRIGLRVALSAAPFDLVWFAGHAGEQGFLLDDGIWPPSEAGRWLLAVRARQFVANACFSAEHVVSIQQIAKVDVVATIAPAGVDDLVAGETALFLARSLVESGDLADATLVASAYGQFQYRFFPCGSMAQSNRADQAQEGDVASLVRAIKGDPFTGSPGLIATVATLAANVATLAQSIELYRSATDARLSALEDARRSEPRITVSLRQLVGVAMVVVLFAATFFILLLRLGGV